MVPQIIENFIISASIRPNVNYIGSSKQNDYLLSLMIKEQVGDLELSRDQSAGTWMKRYHPQLLNTAVQVHPALSDLKQQTARSDLVRSLPLSLQAFLMLFPGPCRWPLSNKRVTLDMTQHGSSQMLLEHKSLAILPGVPQTFDFPLLHPALGPGASTKHVIYNLTLVHVLI